MSSRDPAVTAAYNEYKKHQSSECSFCHLGDREIIAVFDHFVVVHALFPYKIWDERLVLDHLLVLPKEHRLIFNEFTQQESTEILQIISKYELDGYSVYTRAPKDTTRSVAHHHTHLLLLER